MKDVLKSMVDKFKSIETAKDLSRNKLTLAGYIALGITLKEMVDHRNSGEEPTGSTISLCVADWLKENGASIQKQGVGFVARV